MIVDVSDPQRFAAALLKQGHRICEGSIERRDPQRFAAALLKLPDGVTDNTVALVIRSDSLRPY